MWSFRVVRCVHLVTPCAAMCLCSPVHGRTVLSATAWCRIYANSEFQLDATASPAFVSAMDIMAELEESKAPRPGLTKRDLDTYVHVLWGMSKDFAASGYVNAAGYMRAGLWW